MISVRGSLFRNDQDLHGSSFCCHLDYGSALMAEMVLFYLLWKNILIEFDSSLVVQIFSNNCLVSCRLKVRWINCITFTQTIHFRNSHTYREVNICADTLANIGVTCSSFTSFNFVHNKIERD